MSKRKHYSITEYGIITKDEKPQEKSQKNIIHIDEKEFEQIEQFILENKSDESNLSDLLTITYRKPYKKVIQAKNYVGLIETRNRTLIEILPKICGVSEDNLNETRYLFLRMLKTLKNSPFKEFSSTNLRSCKMPLFEVFISKFLDEVELLIKKGICGAYINNQQNSNVLKGRLLLPVHIRENIVHRERFFISYDEFNYNRPENKLIKSTLVLLLNESSSSNNQKRIKEALIMFDTIDYSRNIDKDLSQCSLNKLTRDYSLILEWCKIFLKRKSFSNFRGDSIALALLFPMEHVFESYLSYFFQYKFTEWNTIRLQGSGLQGYLAQERFPVDRKIFYLKPDIFAENQDELTIIDAKWKLLSENDSDNKYNISQSDFYQLFAYGKIYENLKNKKVNLILIYPKNDDFQNPIIFNYKDVNNLSMKVIPFDIKRSLENNAEYVKEFKRIIELKEEIV